jgi:hypothetical protein
MCPVGWSSRLLARRICRYSTPFLFRVAAELSRSTTSSFDLRRLHTSSSLVASPSSSVATEPSSEGPNVTTVTVAILPSSSSSGDVETQDRLTVFLCFVTVLTDLFLSSPFFFFYCLGELFYVCLCTNVTYVEIKASITTFTVFEPILAVE